MLAQKVLSAIRPKVGSLAEELGVDRRTLSFWQNGERTPSAENLEALARLAESQSDDLYILARRLRREAKLKQRDA